MGGVQVLHRSGGEEAAESFFTGDADLEFRDGRVQPGVQVLPELGHFQEPGDGYAGGAGDARGDRGGGDAGGCRSLAFTYNDPVIWAEYALDIAKVAHAHGFKTVAVTAGYISRRGAGRILRADGRGERRPKGIHRGFLRKLCQAQLEPVLETLKFLETRDRCLVRADEPDDPRRERFDRKRPRHVRMDRGEPWAGCAGAFHGISPRLQDDGDAAHAAGDAGASAGRSPWSAGIRYAFVGNVNDELTRARIAMAAGNC